MIRCTIFCLTFLLFSTGTISQTPSSTSTTVQHYVTEEMEGYDGKDSHCFRFTWLGPGFNNMSKKVEGSCDDLAEKYKLKNTPCKQPLVITHNGETPDMDDLFDSYRDLVTCKRSGAQVCIKYSYKFNGDYENVTYMCGKVRTEGEGAETSGCFTEYNSGYETEVCVCKPKTISDDGNMPCNSGNIHGMSALGLLAFFACFLLRPGLTRW